MKITKKNIIFSSGILLILLIIILSIIHLYKIKTAKVEVVLKDNLEVEFNEKRRINSFIKSINGKIPKNNYVNTKKLGKKEITFQYINNDNIKVSYTFSYKVVDKTPPIIWLTKRYSLPVGQDIDLESSIMCGDNYDSTPQCSIEGNYNLNEVGEYPLVYKAEDNSGNKTTQEFILNIYKPQKNSNTPQEEVRTNFEEIRKKHKNKNTKIGLDISKWQEEIDFKKLKEAQVEFVMIRIGGTRGIGGKYFIDEQFKRNITEAKKYHIPVGIYFYSYANSKKQAIKDAKWVIGQIKNYDIDLPIALDWEDWTDFNHYHISFYQLTEIAKSFMKELQDSGYKTMLYSSKNYLEQIWLETNYDTWLAHYTEETNYEGNYLMWQLCENGKVDGIKGNVDIDVMYQNE